LLPQTLAELDRVSVWELFLEAEPLPVRRVPLERVEDIARAFAAFADLKSPWTLSHSTGVAQLAEAAALQLRLPPAETFTVKVAALLHDLGRTSVPNGIWDKPGPLNPIERERAKLHASSTRQILSLTGLLSPYAAIASMDHERVDGSGYPGAATGSPRSARLLQAADVFRALIEARPHRPALSTKRAAEVLVEEARAGRLDLEAVEAVLKASGQSQRVRGELPRGLSQREVEVVKLLARGMSNKQIGAALFISARTVQQHLRHVYEKAQVRTRAAAAVFAMQHGLLGP
jgi:putative nucleotidyltransferase with HDIG domain